MAWFDESIGTDNNAALGVTNLTEDTMSTKGSLGSFKQAGTGLSFIVFPIVFVFAFATHPGLLDPHILSARELIVRARGEGLLHFAHALVTLNAALLMVVAVHFMKVLARSSSEWAGLVGAALAVLGTVSLAAGKGALCLTMSSLDGISDAEFTNMMPGLIAMFEKRGWLVLLWGILLLPIGFGIQAVALIKSKHLPRWKGSLFLLGVFMIGTPDGAELVNLAASALLAVVFIPYGAHLIRSRSQQFVASDDSSLKRTPDGAAQLKRS